MTSKKVKQKQETTRKQASTFVQFPARLLHFQIHLRLVHVFINFCLSSSSSEQPPPSDKIVFRGVVKVECGGTKGDIPLFAIN